MRSYLIGACVLLSIVFLRAIFSSPPRPRVNEDFYGDDGEHFLQGIVRGTTEPHKLVQPGATPGPATISATTKPDKAQGELPYLCMDEVEPEVGPLAPRPEQLRQISGDEKHCPSSRSVLKDSLDSIEGGCGVVSQEASGSLGQVPPSYADLCEKGVW